MSKRAARKILIVPGAFTYDAMAMFKRNGYQGTHDPYDPELWGVCWLGGADISPSMYGEKMLKETAISAEHDRLDTEAWIKTVSRNLVRLGICRGAQFLNVKNGGKLWQHVNNHNNGVHEAIDFIDDSRTKRVTSLHHQAMIPVLGDSVVVAGTYLSTTKVAEYKAWVRNANPGVGKGDERDIEVVWYPKTKSLCFQGHPELDDGEGSEKYFFELIERYAS